MLFWIIFSTILLEGILVTFGQSMGDPRPLNRRNWSFITQRPRSAFTPARRNTRKPVTEKPLEIIAAERSNFVSVTRKNNLNRRDWTTFSVNKGNINNYDVPRVAPPTRASGLVERKQQVIDTRNGLVISPWEQSVKPTAQTNFKTTPRNNQRVNSVTQSSVRNRNNRRNWGSIGQTQEVVRTGSNTQQQTGYTELADESMMFQADVTNTAPVAPTNNPDYGQHITALYAMDSFHHGSEPPTQTPSSARPIKKSNGLHKVLPDGSIVFNFGVLPTPEARKIQTSKTSSSRVVAQRVNSNADASRFSDKTTTVGSKARGVDVTTPGYIALPNAGLPVSAQTRSRKKLDDAIYKTRKVIDDLINGKLSDDLLGHNRFTPRPTQKLNTTLAATKTPQTYASTTALKVTPTKATNTTTIVATKAPTPAPTTTTTTTPTPKPTPKPKRKRKRKLGVPEFMPGAIPINITYANDNHVCPTSRARWQDFTVYLETKPRLCLVQITWNARYEQEEVWHNSFWGPQVDYRYKTVYDPEVKFVDLHAQRGYV